MKIYFVQKQSEGDTEAQLQAMREAGFEFVDLEQAEIIYCASITAMKQTLIAKDLKDIPVVVYCWDYYAWAHEKQNMSGDWRLYAKLLQIADLILVPSQGQKRRLKELLGLKSTVVLSGATTFEQPISDERYILNPLREYPEENNGWVEKAAKELEIPVVTTNHGLTYDEYQYTVAKCSFIASVYREASTGGLSLIEGLWLGKPSLISNSPYQGANDYVGKYARTFQYDSFDELKVVMKKMWDKTPVVDLLKARNYINKKLTYKVMAKNIYDLLTVS